MKQFILINGFKHVIRMGRFYVSGTHVTTRFYIPTDGRVWQAITDAEYAQAQAEGRIRREPTVEAA